VLVQQRRNPNKQSGGVNDYKELPVWPQYDREQQRYMTMNSQDASIGHGPRRRQCAFWKDYIPPLMVATGALIEWLASTVVGVAMLLLAARRQHGGWMDMCGLLLYSTVVVDYTSAMFEWRNEFDKWQNEYMRDWRHEFEMYKRTQAYYRNRDTAASGGQCKP
jgi:acetylcholinesterase